MPTTTKRTARRARLRGVTGHLLDFDAIGRILERVREADNSLGSKFMLPASNDPVAWQSVRVARSDMSNAISWAYTRRNMQGDLTSDSRARQRYAALGRVVRLSRDLGALVDDDALPLRSSLSPYLSMLHERELVGSGLASIMDGIARLKTAAEEERKRLKSAGLDSKAVMSFVDDPTPLATAGQAFIRKLGTAFHDSFGQAPTVAINSEREPHGAFLNFVEAVTSQMGEAMSPDAIRKAWERAHVPGQISEND